MATIDEDLAEAILADDTEFLLSLVKSQGDILTTVHKILFLTAQHSRPRCLAAVSTKYHDEMGNYSYTFYPTNHYIIKS